MALSSAIPLNSGVLSVVILSVFESPVSLDASKSTVIAPKSTLCSEFTTAFIALSVSAFTTVISNSLSRIRSAADTFFILHVAPFASTLPRYVDPFISAFIVSAGLKLSLFIVPVISIRSCDSLVVIISSSVISSTFIHSTSLIAIFTLISSLDWLPTSSVTSEYIVNVVSGVCFSAT